MKASQPSNPLKISLLVHDLSVSGAARWGGNRPFLLYQALKQLGHEVQILGFIFGDESPSEAVASQFPLTVIQGEHFPQFWNSAQQLAQAITGDILYAQQPRVTTLGIALWQKFLTHKPLILDIDDWVLGWYGGDELKYPESLRQFARDLIKPEGALRYPEHPFYLKWSEKFVKYADSVTIHTQFLQNRFGGIYVPNGKNTHQFNPQKYDAQASRKQYDLQDYRILMFPGAPRPYKGLEDILNALDLLDQSDLRLVIVGGSPYDDYDKKLREKWGRWLIQLPIQPVEKMPELVAAAHIVIVPQRDTPITQAQFPLKLTDGMSMAKPVIATRMGDLPEVLGDTGFLVEPSSPSEIAETIKVIFSDYDAALQRGQQARKRCIQWYSLDAMSHSLDQVLQTVTQKSS
ncbi:glycosyltransferase family 4 protein [Spirulina sp. CS-785/01]|uniref:glycosyltransferase family 4 protein n=1 Tax=Spirulina sp. CS-785/01 TaxID=3021716 RepID=UPI00232E02E0|nr:glycosyltransferase family 4 protein [Spirulina sp. CS-785/01]MDB9312348.1 glycosyltransferase family 4 protein [Spirulina sp. CS-785/01]